MFVKTAQGWRQIAGTSEYSPPPMVEVAGNAHILIPTGVATIVPFTTELQDSNGFYDFGTSSSRLVVPAGQGGRYMVVANVYWANFVGNKVATIGKNGLFDYGRMSATNVNSENQFTTTDIIDLAPGDYVELRVYQDSGADQTLYRANRTHTMLKMMRIDGIAAVADGVGQTIGASAYAGVNQSLPNAVTQVLALNSEEHDAYGMHDNVTNNSRITIPTSMGGRYLITARVRFAAGSDTTRYIVVYRNGQTGGTVVAHKYAPATPSPEATNVSLSAIVDLVAGDFLELAAYQATGAALDVIGGPAYNTGLVVQRLDPQAHTHSGFGSITTKSVSAGLTGATAATRYVGGTVSGAPTTGTFMVGDYVVAQDGTIWICSVAGTPGTWIQVSGGLKGVGLSTVYSGGPPDNALGTEGDFWIPDSANNTPPSISNGWLIPDGTVAAPSIAFLSNPDTGFYQDTDGIHYSKDAADRGIILTGSGSKVTVGLQAPTTPQPGDLWVDTNGVEQGMLVTSDTPRLTVGLAAPTTPEPGDLWVAASGV